MFITLYVAVVLNIFVKKSTFIPVLKYQEFLWEIFNIRMRQSSKYQGQNKITKKYRQLIKTTR